MTSDRDDQGQERTRHVGQSMTRVDGPEKVTGSARYSLDTVASGALWVKVLRSPYAHARILRIDVSRARTLPGVHAVLTGDDVRGIRAGKRLRDEPLLAWDRVLFIGDKVAAVAADDEDVAQHALDLITVDYQELPVLDDPGAALAPDAPLLHPDINSYQGLTERYETVTNLYGHDRVEKGDIDAGFAQADLIVEGTYSTPRTHHAYLEPHNCLVEIDGSGQVQVWLGSKSPLANRSQLADILGIPIERIEINFAFVGGDFGGKGDTIGVPICYFLAKETGRPVKMVLDYSEDFIATNPRHAAVMEVKAGVKLDGTITAWQAQFDFSCGAYASTKYSPSLSTAEIAGPYKTPNVRIDSNMVFTNTVPGGYFRAPGETQGIFAGESHMDVVARRLEMDPVELRLKNLIRDNDTLPSGHRYEAVRAEEVLLAAAQQSGFRNAKPPNVGRGIAIGHRPQGGGPTNVSVTVELDGTVIVGTSIFESGAGTYTLLKQIVSDELGISPDRVRVAASAKDIVSPNDMGPVGARVSRVAGEGALQACEQAKQRFLDLAAEFEGWDELLVEYQAGFLVHKSTDERLSMERIVARLGQPVSVRADVNDAASNLYTSFVAQVAEVEVNPETGRVELRLLTSVHDTGRVLNPIGFQGQIDGGVVTGIGFALSEEMIMDEGRITNPSFADFKIPTIQDIPELRTVVLESEDGMGPYRIRGIGEHANITTSPAIANAVADACGVRVADLPITAEKVWGALRRTSPEGLLPSVT